MKKQVLIVGHGISGAVLAYLMRNRGIKVAVFDELNSNSPSRVAAGLWNPVTFKKPSLARDSRRSIPYLKSFYPAMEADLNTNFFFPKKYYRIFSEPEEPAEWQKKFSDPEFSNFASAGIIDLDKPFIAPYGAAEVKEAGYVDVEKMLAASRLSLEEQNSFFPQRFYCDKLKTDAGELQYTTENGTKITADHIVFAEGPGIAENPFFQDLDFRPVKGEVLTVKIPGLKLNDIVSKGFFIFPADNEDEYIAGATYSRKSLDNEITDEAASRLLNKLENCINLPYKVVGQNAGIRPASKDRTPVLGTHHAYKRVHVFNGMGSRAVMSAPKLADDLFEYLFAKKSLSEKVDVKRFY